MQDLFVAVAAQILCILALLVGPLAFMLTVFICVVILDLRLLFDNPSQVRHLGVIALVLWFGWVGYLPLLEETEPWRAAVYSLTVVVTSIASIKRPSKRRVFFLIMLVEALLMQKTPTSVADRATQGLCFTCFAHVLFYGRIAQQEAMSLLWIFVSSIWVLLVPWFIAVPLVGICTAIIIPRARTEMKRAKEVAPDEEAPAPIIEARD